MELLKSTIYLKEYFYTKLDGDDVEFRALSYKELDNIKSKYIKKTHTSIIDIVKLALINLEDFYTLTYNDILGIHSNIIKVSSVTQEDIEDIKEAVTITLDDTFKDDTFSSCKLCQERKLDKQRNCPLLHDSEHDPMVFYIVDSKKLTVCPMDTVNSEKVNDAFRCYNMAESGFLPLAGGMYDQTMFFVEVSVLIKGIINRHSAKELKKKK